MVTEQQIRRALDATKGVKIMILDACRDNPWAERFKAQRRTTRAFDQTRGLARVENKTEGLFIAYAAMPGYTASDGPNAHNSPFSSALLKWMADPTLEISAMFRRVANEVLDDTKGLQRPEFTSNLTQEFFLNISGTGSAFTIPPIRAS
jgi:uncharacterized caspase-like protein